MNKERIIEILGNKWRRAHPCDVIQVADLILTELAAEKPTAPAGLVDELRAWSMLCGSGDGDRRCFGTLEFDRILSRYEARKEVVLGECHLVKFIDQTGRPSYFCARRHEGKRGKLIFVEEDSK